MKQAKTTMQLVARWLVMLAACFVVSSSSGFASAPTQAKSSCAASCSKHCPCCISKSAPVDSSAPLAPASPTRTTVAKDFQLMPLLTSLLALDREILTPVPLHFSASYFSASLPLFVRQCAFLI